MKLDKNYKVRVTPEQSREIHSLILLAGGEVSYGLKPQIQDEFLVIENEYGSVVIYYTDQDIFLSAEQQEIQADELIALLADLSKSAENTLENTELAPEFEAPPKPLTGIELAKKLIAKGHNYLVVDTVIGIRVLTRLEGNTLIDSNNVRLDELDDITPLDDETGEPLTESVLDE